MGAQIVGRVIAGAAGSGLYLAALNYVSALTTPEERGTYLTGIGFVWGIGACLGPVVGGAFVVSSVTWRFAFYINLIIGAASSPALLFALPLYRASLKTPIIDRLQAFDWVGLVLGAGMWVAFTMAFTMAGGQWSWADGRTIATIVVFAVLTVLYGVQQTFCIFTTPESRAFPVHLIRRSRTQILLFVGTTSNIVQLYVVIYFIPIYFQFVHGDSAMNAAVRLLPYIIVTQCFNLATGHLLSSVLRGYYMPIFLVSGLVSTVGGVLLTAYLDPSASTSKIYAFTVINAVGVGLTIQIGYSVASMNVKPELGEHPGQGLTLQNVAQIGGQVIALVLAGQVFQSVATQGLREVLAGGGYSDADIQSIVAGAQSQVYQQLSSALKEQVIIAITRAMQRSFILVCIAGGTLTLSGALMKREKLFGQVPVAVGA